MLATTLADVRKRITKRPKLNENDTKATLIEPVLQALGWGIPQPRGDTDEGRDARRFRLRAGAPDRV
ncbi:MAG: hypothetical protein IPJ77_07375 [Planctomycetes bacterium]|nr:hypothetical protein [Planctomycetota bacterium]